MSRAVFCLVDSDEQAEAIVAELRLAGFSRGDISVLFPDQTGTRHFAHALRSKAPEGTAAGVGAGGLIGALLGWLAGTGALAIPGLGPFVAAGPLLAALSAAAIGATLGGIAGALVGLGIPEFEAKRFAGKIAGGNYLISVHTEASNERKVAREVFERLGAHDITSAGEAQTEAMARGV
ncbi:MAG TPA: hypothetical protein VIS07_19275 [Candidatus Binatia bacterium]